MGSLENPTRSVQTRDGLFGVEYWDDFRAPSELVNIDNYLMARERCVWTLDTNTLKTTIHCRDPSFLPERASMGVRAALENVSSVRVREALESLDRYSQLRSVNGMIKGVQERMEHASTPQERQQLASRLSTLRSHLTVVMTALATSKAQKESADAALMRSRSATIAQMYAQLQQEGLQFTQEELATIASCG
ncbi:Hypothetical protein D9617_5g070030 [Elsinoe fawcettii]|nr:Hypothetical protein D9617_5g070030 [Elsinoe fawcettii]